MPVEEPISNQPAETPAWLPVLRALQQPELERAILSGPARLVASPWKKVTIRPIQLRGKRVLQFVYFDGRKTLTQQPAEPMTALESLAAAGFAAYHILTHHEELNVRVSRKGAWHSDRKPRRDAHASAALPAHNRVKSQPLQEGIPHPVLELLGIATPEGTIKPTRRAKFTQINEFLRHLEVGLKATRLDQQNRTLQVLDCGCGLSYLTIAVHDYLNRVRGLPAEVLGVDMNPDVIRASQARQSRLGAVELNFACRAIGQLQTRADIVLALHACNTATDDALHQAVRSQAKLILCAPCCHQELNQQLRQNRQSAARDLHGELLRHGILRERIADLLTDTLRAAWLRHQGYRVEVVEFVSPEHTARNLLIRAVHTGTRDPDAYTHAESLSQAWGVRSPLFSERILGIATAVFSQDRANSSRITDTETTADHPSPADGNNA